jgi:D-alanyl-D-alanine carboxypeptidase
LSATRQGLDTVLASLGIPRDSLAARSLVAYPEAAELLIAWIGDEGRQYLLVPEAARAWRLMRAAAARDGITLALVSAFRSVRRQAQLIRSKLDEGLSLERILAESAPPGFSEHHTGRAIDLTTPPLNGLEPGFATTPAFDWLSRHAGRFGFVLSFPEGNRYGYVHEPWHWCYQVGAT